MAGGKSLTIGGEIDSSYLFDSNYKVTIKAENLSMASLIVAFCEELKHNKRVITVPVTCCNPKTVDSPK